MAERHETSEPAAGFSRRALLRGGAMLAAAPALLPVAGYAGRAAEPGDGDPWLGLRIGVASYTFRTQPLEGAERSAASGAWGCRMSRSRTSTCR